MNYIIDDKKTGQGRLVLKRSRRLQIVMSILLLVIGVPFLLAGGIMLLDPGKTAFFWGGMGLLQCVFALILITQLKLPENLIFDNNTGHLRIYESRSGKEEYKAFSYGDILNINMRLHRSGETTYHVVELEKKDGAFWTLYQSVSEKKAEKVLGLVKKHLNLDTAGEDSRELNLKSGFQVKRGTESSSVSWKMKNSLSAHLLGALAITSFGMIFYGMDPYIESELGYNIGVIFMITVASLFIFFTFYNAGRKHTVIISDKSLRFTSSGLFNRKSGFNIPLASIDAILFNFSTNTLENSIFIMKKNETELFQRVKRGNIDFMDIKSAIVLMLNIKKINAGALTIREKIELEWIIQDLVREQSGIDDL